jgi:hypothetical protein
MNRTTQEALADVSRMLHEAGWDAETRALESLDEEKINRLRFAYHDLLRSDYFEILDRTLGKRQSIRQAGDEMGLSENGANELFREALQRLDEFTSVSTNQGFVAHRPPMQV